MELITQEAAEFTDEQKRLITDTLCKGATSNEIAFFMEVAKRTKLDPFRKQLHAVKRWDAKLQRDVMTFQVGIDGLRAIAARTGEYIGSDDVSFIDGDGRPHSATCTVWRLVRGVKAGFTATVFFAECVQTKRDGSANAMWSTRPYGQLGKCAEAAALRKGFPEETGGLYLDEELPHPDDSRIVPQPTTARARALELRRKQQEQEIEIPAHEPDPETTPDLFNDLLVIVSEATEPDALVDAIKQAEGLPDPSATQSVKRAISRRAKALGLEWDTTVMTFIPKA